MRTITRNVVIGILVVVVLLLALGALPSLLKSGDPYYVTAEPVDSDRAAVNVTAFSDRQFPYTKTAIETGESEPYWRGPTGLKESFTHSPFDEFRALDERDVRGSGTNRTDMGAVSPAENVAYVSQDGTVYRLEVEQRAE